MSVFIELTAEFNQGGLRAIISSGQAVVLHRLAMMSKDGDWIVRESQAALDHILCVLERRGARYRYGAPFFPVHRAFPLRIWRASGRNRKDVRFPS